MRRFLALVFSVLPLATQVEPNAGQWKTWVIASGKRDEASRAPAE